MFLKHINRHFDRYLAALSLALLIAAFASGARGDYLPYQEHWQWIMAGHDPWAFPGHGATDNAYGPLYLLLAPLYQLHPLGPKLLFTAAWLLFGLAYLAKIRRDLTPSPGQLLALTGYFFLFPFFIDEIVRRGHFDILVGLSSLAAILLARRDREVAAGIALAAGILLKFMPLMLVPFIAYERRRIRWVFVVSTVVTTALGFGVCYLRWGTSFLTPILYAGDRPSKLLSVFALLRGTLSPLQFFADQPNVDFLSLPCMALAGLTLVALHLGRGFSSLGSSLLAYAVILALYKVGHQQFFCLVFVLLPAWYLEARAVLPPKPPRALRSYIYFFGLFSLLYTWTGGFHAAGWQWGRQGAFSPVLLWLTASLSALIYRAESELALGLSTHRSHVPQKEVL